MPLLMMTLFAAALLIVIQNVDDVELRSEAASAAAAVAAACKALLALVHVLKDDRPGSLSKSRLEEVRASGSRAADLFRSSVCSSWPSRIP